MIVIKSLTGKVLRQVAADTLYGADLRDADLYGANLRGAKSLATSHDAAAEILRRAATAAAQERYASWILLRREWCWKVWREKLAEAPQDIRDWAVAALCADEAWGFQLRLEEARDD